MNQLYQLFYRDTGVRRFNELISPRFNLFKGFPRNSIYHHLSNDDELFQDSSKPWFKGYAKRLPFELVFHSDFIIGHPRVVPFVPQRFTLPFIKKHKKFRYLQHAVEFPVDQRTLIIVNYNPLKLVYRYFHTPVSDYQKWESIQRTFWAGVSKAAMSTSRQQFVLMEPIHDIPSFNLLNNYADKDGLTLTRLFNSNDKRFVLHLSNFLKHDLRDRSVFSVINLKALSKINIIFILKDGRCSTLNLAYLYSWVKGDENVSTLRISLQRDEKPIIRTLLKYLLVLSAEHPEDAAEQIETSPEENIQNENEDAIDEEESDEEDDDRFINNAVKPSSIFNKQEILQEPIPISNAIDDEKGFSNKISDNIDQDLEILEKKTREDLHKRGLTIKDNEVVEITPDKIIYTHEEVHSEIHTALKPNSSLNKKIEDALKTGALNPATYNKARADAAKYEKTLDPYGTKIPINEQIIVDPNANIVNNKKAKLVNNKTTFDLSMGKSTLQTFTRDYVHEHLHKDVLKMVGGLQRGGIIIQDHEINIEHNITGAVEQHRLELKPIDGVSSAVWFKLPVVEHDGTFKVGGNKYMLRKQRVDLNFCF